ncbi:MAG: DUF4258 domain-containing protein [Lentimicrobium sp.]
MADKKLIFSNHAVKQMFQRNISVDDVKFVLNNGIPVNEYPDDKPLPSMLIFADCNGRSLHVVCSENQLENEIVIITAYEASTDIWENDFVTRKK